MALHVCIQKRYGSFLLDVSFIAPDGETLALLGASGSGKSATLRCIAGIDRPDRGRIELNGQVFFDSDQRVNLPPQRRRVGYLFQQYALFPHMTVEENISVCLGRMEQGQRQARISELSAMLRLEGLEGLRPHQLSGGQQQRVALARILASEPRLILLDEPFAALDSYLKWQVEQDLRDVLARFAGPSLWVSHDLGEIYRSCNQVCVLDRGRSSMVKEVRELVERPATVIAAQISGCRNFVPVQPGPRPGQIRIPDWGVTLQSAAPWRPDTSILGIRADRVRPAGMAEVNAFPCVCVRLTEDMSAQMVALRPVGAHPDAPLLLMDLDKDAWAVVPDHERLWVSIEPEHLLLLEQQGG